MPNILPPFKLNYEYLDVLHSDKEYTIYQPEKISGRRYENIQISTDNRVIRLQDKTQRDIVSLVVMDFVNYHGIDYYEIKWTKSTTPRRKFLSYLFELLLIEFEYQIISDETHTSPGSKEYWISLKKKKKYDLFIYNVDSNYKRRYDNVAENKIWGLTRDYYDQISSIIFDNTDYDIYEESSDFIEDYEFEGFEQIDLTVLNATIASQEIFSFVKKFNGEIVNRNHIRLIAKKIT